MITNTTQRFGWMDAIRGAAIILVVFGHATYYTDLYTDHTFTRFGAFTNIVSPLRMPLLLFLSGLLVPRSMTKGPRRYFSGKAKNILYPYVLWSLLIIVAYWLVSQTIPTWYVPPVWAIVTAPPLQLWFLAYLLVYYAIAYATRSVSPLWVVFGAIVLMGIPMEGAWGSIALRAVPFFLGVWIARNPAPFEKLTSNVWASAVLLAISVLLAVGRQFGILTVPDLSWAFPLLLAFFVGVVGVLRPISEHWVLAPLRYVGKSSMKMYVIHAPAITITIALLTTRGYREPWGVLLAAIAVGYIPALIAMFLSDHVKPLEWLFAWNPGGRRKPVSELQSSENFDAVVVADGGLTGPNNPESVPR